MHSPGPSRSPPDLPIQRQEGFPMNKSFPPDLPPRRREGLRQASAWAAVFAAGGGLELATTAARAEPAKELRIGYQKSASLFLLQKAQGTLEKRLQPQGVGVK